jgi:predicted transcriptional regulator
MSFRVTPQFKEKLDRVAKKSGRSLAQEIELRLERSLDEERHLAEALELAFDRQVAGLMLAIGCVLREEWLSHPTSERSDWLSDPKAFRAVAESINLWLELIDPTTPTKAGTIRAILDDSNTEGTPAETAAIVATALSDVEEWKGWFDIGPLTSTIRGWLGAAVIGRLRDGLALPPPPSE